MNATHATHLHNKGLHNMQTRLHRAEELLKAAVAQLGVPHKRTQELREVVLDLRVQIEKIKAK